MGTLRILCFGDSNTWGFNPHTQNRFPDDVRWTGVLSRDLGARAIVIEEGLNGRTTVLDDPFQPGLNGQTYLVPCIRSQSAPGSGRDHVGNE